MLNVLRRDYDLPLAVVDRMARSLGTAFLSADIPATSTITRELLGWRPTGPTLLEDIAAGHYDQP
ncbi:MULTISPECIES: hypothetical protein [unclassified Nonomuraea]|uniref:hypothetical protein n=1 Tax=unclassified Nonomuraea TaxID=2593643 RepID=UPI00191BD5A3|nr:MULTISPECIES: hypothetical protein [unclassified Nonomuraea]